MLLAVDDTGQTGVGCLDFRGFTTIDLTFGPSKDETSIVRYDDDNEFQIRIKLK